MQMPESMQLKSPMQPPLLSFNLQGQLLGVDGLSAEVLKQINWVTVPTQQLLLTQAMVPGKSKSQWQQALPYAFEESLAQPVDQLFFKVFERDGGGVTQVASIDKAQMQTWVETLQATGLGHAQLIADCFLLPEPKAEGIWSVQLADNLEGFVSVRTERFSGFAGDVAWLETLADIERARGHAVTMESQSISMSVPEFNRLALQKFGLREGVYQPRQQKQSKVKPWLWPTVAAAFLVLVLLGELVWKTQQIEQQRELLEQQTTALFQKMFPNIKRIVNMQAQAKTALSQSAADETLGPVAISQALEKVLKTQTNIEVQSLVWRGQEMQFTLQATSLAVLQAVEQQLKQNKAFKVRLEVQTMQSAKVSARLVIHV